MNWINFWLGVFILGVIPFVLAAYGGQLAAETIADLKARRKKVRIFWGLCIFGVFLAACYQYSVEKTDEERQFNAIKAEEAHQRKADEAQEVALKAQVDLRTIEKSNGDQIAALKARVQELIATAKNPDQKNAAIDLNQAITTALSEQLARQQARLPPPVSSNSSMAPPSPTSPRKCSGDNLGDCDDEELLKWGAPLSASVDDIESTYMADLKSLDQIKGGNILSFLTGNDKDSKWIRLYAAAEEKAADRFRDCCAENSLKYHKEMAQRVGGGLQKTELYGWIEKLLRPIGSKEWKQARKEGGDHVTDLKFGLDILRIRMNEKIRLAKTK